MSGPNYVLDDGFMCAAAVTAYQIVKFGATDDTCTPIAAVTDEMLGVAQEACATADINNRLINVRLVGISYVIVGATAVVRGNRLKTDNVGKVIPATTDADFIVGRAMMSGAVGDMITMLVTTVGQRGTA